MKSIAILVLALSATSVVSDCLSSEQLAALNFTASAALVTYTTDTPPAYCVDYWTNDGSCVNVDEWADELAANLQQRGPEGGRGGCDFPRDNSSTTTADSTTDATADATQEAACKAANDAVFNKYFCILASGAASTAATFTSDNLIDTITVADADAQSIYDACSALFNQRCVTDAANASSSTTTNSDSTSTDADASVADDRAAQCTNIAACIAANDGTNCLSDIKAQVLNFFKHVKKGGDHGQRGGPGRNNQNRGPGGPGGRGPNNQNQRGPGQNNRQGGSSQSNGNGRQQRGQPVFGRNN